MLKIGEKFKFRGVPLGEGGILGLWIVVQGMGGPLHSLVEFYECPLGGGVGKCEIFVAFLVLDW